jgi:prophage protein DUF1660
MIGWILCKLKGHNFRRARKGQDQSLKYCRRCPASTAIRKRTPKEKAA